MVTQYDAKMFKGRTMKLTLVAIGVLLILGTGTTVKAETNMQLAGRVTAYASLCGFYGPASEMKGKFKNNSEFSKSLQDNDLSGADSVSGLDCSAVQRVMDIFLREPSKVSSKTLDEEQVNCLFPGTNRTVRVRVSSCRNVKGGIFPEETTVK